MTSRDPHRDRRDGHNGGPPLEDLVTLEQAQQHPQVQRRPSYLQRYAGPGAPLVDIVGLGGLGVFGRWVLLRCGHWREIRDYDLLPLLGRAHPVRARCGLCREGIAPAAADLETALRLSPPAPPPAPSLFDSTGGGDG